MGRRRPGGGPRGPGTVPWRSRVADHSSGGRRNGPRLQPIPLDDQMATQEKTRPVAERRSETVKRELLHAGPQNSRKVYHDLDELAQSIRTDGMLEPLLVRPHPKRGGDHLEIMAGSRRWKAAAIAKLDLIPVVVIDADDATARRICAAENLQRSDLEPIEEARAIQHLVDDLGTKLAANQLGKTLAYVARRSNLLNLSPKWTKLVQPKGEYSGWPARVLELIALLGHTEQDGLFREWQFQNAENIPSLGIVKQAVFSGLCVLKAATWKLDDAELVPKQGACTDCTRNSAARSGLFEDEVEGDLETATCQDAGCWEEKETASAQRKLDAAKAKHGRALKLIGGPWDSQRVRGTDGKKEDRLGELELEHFDYRASKKGAKGAVPGFVVTGKGFGTVKWIKPTATRSDGTTSSKGKGPKVEPGTIEDLKAKRERLKRRRDGFLVDWIREWIAEHEAAPLTIDKLAPLMLAYGVPSHGENDHGFGFRKRKKTAEGYAVGQLWVRARGPMETALTRHDTGQLAAQLSEAKWLLEQLAPQLWRQSWTEANAAAVQEIPVPKGLAKLEAARGKPAKKGAKKKAAKRRTKPTAKKRAPKRGASKKPTRKKRKASKRRKV